MFSTHSGDPTAGNDCLRKGIKKSATFSSNPMATAGIQASPVSSLEYHNPSLSAQLHTSFHCIKHSWFCYCPAGELAQAPTSPPIPAWSCPSSFIPPLQLFRGLNVSLHTSAIAFLCALEHISLCPGVFAPAFSTCYNHTRPPDLHSPA